jgi:hypothetical protein
VRVPGVRLGLILVVYSSLRYVLYFSSSRSSFSSLVCGRFNVEM